MSNSSYKQFIKLKAPVNFGTENDAKRYANDLASGLKFQYPTKESNVRGYEYPRRDERSKQLAEEDFISESGFSVLPKRIVEQLQEIFADLDRYNDYIVSRLELIKGIRNETALKPEMERVAARIPYLEREFNLGQMLCMIEDDYLNSDKESKKAKEYISWNQFFDYFKKHCADWKIDKPKKDIENKQEYQSYHQRLPQILPEPFEEKEPEEELDPEDEIVMKTASYMLLHDIFDSQNRLLNEMVSTADFVISAKRDPQAKTILKEKARNASEESQFPEENIGQFLDRVLMEAPNFVYWEHICEYMTTRGRPKQIEEKKSIYENFAETVAKPKGSKKNVEKSSPEKPDFQEADPYYQLEELEERMRLNNELKNGNIQAKSLRALNEVKIDDSDSEDELMHNYRSQYTTKPITIPKGPSLLKREKSTGIRDRKFKEMVEEEERRIKEIMSERPRVKSVPPQVSMPLFTNIMQKQEEKRIINKFKAEEMTRMKESPFNFYKRDQEKQKMKEMEKEAERLKKGEPIFKARSIPQDVLEPKYAKMQEDKLQSKKENVEKRKKELLEKAKLPSERMEKSLKEQMERKKKGEVIGLGGKKVEAEHEKCSFKPKIKDKVPNFEGDYKKLQEELESKKVEKSKTEAAAFQFMNPEIENKRKQIAEERRLLKLKKEKEAYEAKQAKLNPKASYKKEESSKMGEEEGTGSLNLTDKVPMSQKMKDEMERKAKETADRKKKEKEIADAKKEAERKEKEEKERKENEARVKKEEADRKRKDEQMIKDKAGKEEYNQKLKEMKEKVDKKPTLIKSTGHGSKFLAGIRAKINEASKTQSQMKSKNGSLMGDENKPGDEEAEGEIIKEDELNVSEGAKENEEKRRNEELIAKREEELKRKKDEEMKKKAKEDEERQKQNQIKLENEEKKKKQREEELRRKREEEEAERLRLEEEGRRMEEEEEERQRQADEEAERQRLAEEEAERQRLAEEEAERQRLADEKAERERLAEEEAERQRLAEEEAEMQRLAEEEAERQRLADEKAERERLAKEAAEKKKLEEKENERKRKAEEAESLKIEEDKRKEDEKQKRILEEKLRKEKEEEELVKKQKRAEEDKKQKENEAEGQRKRSEAARIKQEQERRIQEEEEAKKQAGRKKQIVEEEVQDDTEKMGDSQGVVDEEIDYPEDFDKQDLEDSSMAKSEIPKKDLDENKKKEPKSDNDLMEGIDPNSILFKVLNDCVSKNKNFQDSEFPAKIETITKDKNHGSYEKYFVPSKWLRPHEIFNCDYNEIMLFDNIDPNDIKQGLLGNCYFLATLSALAEFPERVKKIFNNKKTNKYGVYSVTIYLKGIPTEILVDDYFPCFNGNPLFSKPVGKELWVMILEKAWAKLFKQYTIAEGGLPHQAMEYLMGAPSQGFSDSEKENNLFKNPGALGDMFAECDKMAYLLSAGTKGQGEGKSSKGIVAGHAYTMLSVYDAGGGKEILKMRNPWGNFEWQGEYSDNSSKWTESLKQKVNFVKADDGCFFMTAEEFVDQYDQFCICYVRDNFQYRYVKIKRPPHKSAYFTFELKKNLTAYLRVHQMMERIVQQTQADYKYSGVDFLLLQKDASTGSYTKILATGGKDRHFGYFSVLANNEAHLSLAQGSYLLKTKVRWYDQKVNEYVVSMYSESPIELQEIENSAGKTHLAKLYINETKASLEDIFDSERRFGSGKVGDVYVVIGQNSSKSAGFTCKVDIGESLNMKIGKKNKQNETNVVLDVKPGSTEFALIKTINKTGASKISMKFNFEGS